MIFFINAFTAAFLASIASGIAGTFVYIKKITFIAGGLAHAILGAIGFSVFMGFSPMKGAIIGSILFSLLIVVIKNLSLHNEDTIIGTLWSGGMAAGVLFTYMTPGYNSNLMTWLFGNILMVSKNDLFYLALLDLAVIAIFFVFYKMFLLTSFDSDFASVKRLKVSLLNFLMFSAISITIVILMQVVGLILVIALLTVPPAIASLFSCRIPVIIASSFLLSLVFTFSGITLSYFVNAPSGAVIIIMGVTFYFISIVIHGLTKKFIYNSNKK